MNDQSVDSSEPTESGGHVETEEEEPEEETASYGALDKIGLGAIYTSVLSGGAAIATGGVPVPSPTVTPFGLLAYSAELPMRLPAAVASAAGSGNALAAASVTAFAVGGAAVTADAARDAVRRRVGDESESETVEAEQSEGEGEGETNERSESEEVGQDRTQESAVEFDDLDGSEESEIVEGMAGREEGEDVDGNDEDVSESEGTEQGNSGWD